MKTPDLHHAAAARTPAEAAASFDRSVHAALSRYTGGLSLVSLGLALADWAWHLAGAPGTAARLATQAPLAALEALHKAAQGLDGATDDPRFADAAWSVWPFAAAATLHHAAEQWWQDATELRGQDHHHHDVVQLFARQWLDMMSPSNWPWSNPQVLRATAESRGDNLLRGLAHALDDWRRTQGLAPLQEPGPARRPGHEVACTPGQVVHRNHLVELIQYAPQTPRVQRAPVFIVPSWIMKYYILDLSPHNSMVRWLVGQGHTVFMLSWRNPDENDALLDMEDYARLGVLDSLAAVSALTGGVPIHAAGYCLGGTLLAIAAAALARRQGVQGGEVIAPLATLTLLAAEVDFREPGELGILVDEAQVAMLEDMMAERGFLTGRQMAASFQFLHARDLIWSTRMREYLLGEREAPSDLMAWNADLTRMPATMHSHYLHSLYLHNDLAEGRYEVEGAPVALGDLRRPMFVVGTVKDHVSPWHSVYKIHRLAPHADISFVLTSGGHNAGIVSEPGHAGRDYRLLISRAAETRLTAEDWQQAAPRFEGSWWPAWHHWLVTHDGGTVPARHLDRSPALGPAPGTYVHMCYDD
jgi:polyhydroxyalkanoate synthase